MSPVPSSTGSVAAYLVLTDASAPALTGWQADLAIFGDGAVTGHAVLAVGAVDEGTGDTHLVSLPSPVPTSLHTVLAVWTLALQPGNPQFGLDWGRMEFWLAPAAGRPEADPGYFDGDGAFHGCQSLNSAYHGWGTVPCMLLNDGYGVTDAEARSFGGLKALYR